MMHRAAGLQAAVAYAGVHVDQRTGAALGHAEPGALALLTGEVHPEQVGQHAGARVELLLRQGDRVQAADGVVGRDVGDSVPARAAITFGGHQVDDHAVGIAEGEHLFVVSIGRLVDVDPQLLEPLVPPPQRRSRHAECRRRRHPGSLAPLGDTRPGEERQQARRTPLLVPVVEVIRVRRVEVDRLLDQSQAEGSRVEVDVGLRVGGDRGDVMQSVRTDAGHGRDAPLSGNA